MFTKTYRPDALVVVVRSVWVLVSVSVTVEPRTTAPDWSVTTPTKVQVATDCAPLGRTVTAQITNSASERTSLLKRMGCLREKARAFSSRSLRDAGRLSLSKI